ncbi:MAG: hypothetical protein KDA91_14900 [Planctomycetaceae bacterium]|nr:hypothetical protein [Planctomycetaceae bacterium]
MTPKLTEAACHYNDANHLSSRTLIHNCCRFAAHCGDLELSQYQADHLAEFRRKTVQHMSPWTIEKTITDVITVLSANGIQLSPGRRLRRNLADRNPVPIAAIDQVWPHCDPWLQQWIVLSYWTATRLADSIRLQLKLNGETTLHLTANKTGHCHRWPVPMWLGPWLQPMALPFWKSNDNAQDIVRTAITAACNAAGCERWQPKELRQRALTAWSQADGQAGRIVHGCGLGVLAHYLDPAEVLAAHAHKVRLPSCFGATEHQPDISLDFLRLDSDAQAIVRQTLLRLASTSR